LALTWSVSNGHARCIRRRQAVILGLNSIVSTAPANYFPVHWGVCRSGEQPFEHATDREGEPCVATGIQPTACHSQLPEAALVLALDEPLQGSLDRRLVPGNPASNNESRAETRSVNQNG
jgi:hypothetical protein